MTNFAWWGVIPPTHGSDVLGPIYGDNSPILDASDPRHSDHIPGVIYTFPELIGPRDPIAPVLIPFFYEIPNEGIPGIELKYIGMDSNSVHKNRLAEANQLLVECEEDLYDADEVNLGLWQCLEDSEAELAEVREQLEETQEALAELLQEVFLLLSSEFDESNPEMQLLQMVMPVIQEKYLKKA